MLLRRAAQNRVLRLGHRSIFTIFFTLIALTGKPALAQQNELKQIASSLAKDINAGNRHTVTVADFTDLQGNVTELGRFISEELSTELVMEAKSFTVVERIQLAAILKEHQISVSGLVDPATIRKLGQFAGVDSIVTGTLVPFADSVRLTAKVLDVSTAKVMAVSATDLPRTKAVDDLLSRGISGGVSLPSQQSGGRSSPTSPQKLPSLQTVQQNELQLVIKSCGHRGESLLCSGSVTNKSEKAKNMGIYSGGDNTSAVDNNGNSYSSERVSFGQLNGNSQIQLMPELPMNFFLAFSSPDKNASAVTVVLSYYVEGARENPSKAVFRNIVIAQR